MNALEELRSGLIEECNVRLLASSRTTDVGTTYGTRAKGRHGVQGPFYHEIGRVKRWIDCLSNPETDELPPNLKKEWEALQRGQKIPMLGQMTERRMSVSRLLSLPWPNRRMTDYDFHLAPEEEYAFPDKKLIEPKWYNSTSITTFRDPYKGTREEVLTKLRRFFEGIPPTFPVRTYE